METTHYHYLSAQPDAPLFIWQLKVLLTSLRGLGVPVSNIHLLFLLEERTEPSQEALALGVDATLHFYQDRPEYASQRRTYGPSSKHYCYAKFYEECPELAASGRLFFAESDLAFLQLPELPSTEGVWYWSPGQPYLTSSPLDNVYGQETTEETIGFHMVGGQGVDSNFWYVIEHLSNQVYHEQYTKYGNKLPKNHNYWIAEMRVWMWVSRNVAPVKHIIHPELNFYCGGGTILDERKFIHQLHSRGFSKRNYTDKEPWGELSRYNLHDSFQGALYIKALRAAAERYGETVG